MSRKNHQVVNCRLLQTDKPFSQLKQTQKRKSTSGCIRNTAPFIRRSGRYRTQGTTTASFLQPTERLRKPGFGFPWARSKNTFSVGRTRSGNAMKKSLQERSFWQKRKKFRFCHALLVCHFPAAPDHAMQSTTARTRDSFFPLFFKGCILRFFR